MIIIKKHAALLIMAALICSQVQIAARTAAKEPENTLSIRHIAKTPDGVQQILGLETIENITDTYYYTAEASPVASEFLKNGYKLADEKNRVIEADVVSNGGKIDLLYTPELKTVEVTYFKSDGADEKEMGTISDNAYVGAEYKPQLPVYEDADVLTSLAGDVKYIIGPGENHFKVSYTVQEKSDDEPQGLTRSGRRGRLAEGEGAYLTNIPAERSRSRTQTVQSETDNSDNRLSKEELFSMLSAAAGGELSSGASFEDTITYLTGSGIAPFTEHNISDFITWNEFFGYMNGLNSYISQDSGADRLYTDQMMLYVDGSAYVEKQEAAAAINEAIRSK